MNKGGLSWHWAVIALEVLVAAACFYAGWRLVTRPPAGPIEVHRQAPVESGVDPFSAVPVAPTSSPRPAVGLGVNPGGDLLSRLNHDDLAMYRSQWQVIQLLVDGTRQYIEKRVIPALLPG